MPNPFRMVWFYNSLSGAVVEEPAIGDTIQSHLPGWHGPFNSKQEALDFYTKNKAANPGWKAPGGLGQNFQHLGQSATQGIIGSLNADNILLRVGEVILGVVLVAVALNALLKNPVGKVAAVVP